MGLRTTKGNEDARGARTLACRVRTPANTRRSQKCERGTHECLRHEASSTESVPVWFRLRRVRESVN
jgi:hypothetical protein